MTNARRVMVSLKMGTDAPTIAFPVNVGANTIIGEFKDLVKAKKPNDLVNVDADRLVVSFCFDTHFTHLIGCSLCRCILLSITVACVSPRKRVRIWIQWLNCKANASSSKPLLQVFLKP